MRIAFYLKHPLHVCGNFNNLKKNLLQEVQQQSFKLALSHQINRVA
jgi:hypothetical protein